jgi:type I restriction enzyme R subunit
MLGRATRLCDEIGKESFRIFDAVRLYEALGSMTAMQPVVVDPKITFLQLTNELATLKDEKAQTLARDQFIAKFNAKRRHITEESAKDFEIVCGMTPEKFAQKLKAMTPEAVGAWFSGNPELGEILDRKGPTKSVSILVSDHPDSLKSTERGYGNALKPDDYLKAFSDFLKASGNRIPALTAVLTRPRDLTRKQLKELRMALDHAGYSENSLHNAYRDTTNQDIAAGVIGYIRQAALGDALVPYEQRVDQALNKILGSRKWSGSQEEWLRIIANQTKVNLLVDREALSDDNLIFRTQGGGFDRLNRIFDGQLEPILNQFNESLWPNAAASKGR